MAEKRQERDRRPEDTKGRTGEQGPHHIADEPTVDADSLGATVQSPTTETGLSVEEQVRKEWDSKKDGGLPTGLRKEPR